MLALLLDEQISPVVAARLRERRPGLRVECVARWREGALAGQADERVLHAAAEDALTLVTYDLRTIPRLLAEWATCSQAHAGIIFVDQHTIRPSDFGGLVRALELVWDRERDEAWTNRIVFLEQA